MSEFKKGDRFRLAGGGASPAGAVITLKGFEHGTWDVEEPNAGIFTEPYLAGLQRVHHDLVPGDKLVLTRGMCGGTDTVPGQVLTYTGDAPDAFPGNPQMFLDAGGAVAEQWSVNHVAGELAALRKLTEAELKAVNRLGNGCKMYSDYGTSTKAMRDADGNVRLELGWKSPIVVAGAYLMELEPAQASDTKTSDSMAELALSVPLGYRYLATDESGSVWAYTSKPVVRETISGWGVGVSTDRAHLVKPPTAPGRYAPDWRFSLYQIGQSMRNHTHVGAIDAAVAGAQCPVGQVDAAEAGARRYTNDLERKCTADDEKIQRYMAAEYNLRGILALPTPPVESVISGTVGEVVEAVRRQAERIKYLERKVELEQKARSIEEEKVKVCDNQITLHVETLRNQGARIHAQREQLSALERKCREQANSLATMAGEVDALRQDVSALRAMNENQYATIKAYQHGDAACARIRVLKNQLDGEQWRSNNKTETIKEWQVLFAKLRVAIKENAQYTEEDVVTSAVAKLALVESLREQLRQRTQERDAAHQRLSYEDIGNLREQAEAWFAVSAVLNEVAPNHGRYGGTGMEDACTAIRELARIGKARESVIMEVRDVMGLGESELLVPAVRTLVSNCKSFHQTLHEAGSVMSLDSGSDVATKLVPAIRALISEHNRLDDLNVELGRQGQHCIRLTAAEVQSGFSRVRCAEGLIKQLPESHEGRNRWLMNYGSRDVAIPLRAAWEKRTGLAYPRQSGAQGNEPDELAGLPVTEFSARAIDRMVEDLTRDVCMVFGMPGWMLRTGDIKF